MSRRTQLTHEFVDAIPRELEEGVLYVSILYATAAHLCLCGCRNEINTPLSPTDWRLTFDGISVSLHPSVANWRFECQSHYWIDRDRVEWAGRMAPELIEAGRARARRAKDEYFGESRAVPRIPAEVEPAAKTEARGPISKLLSRFRRRGQPTTAS